MSSEILNIYDLKNLIIGPTCFKTPSGTDIDQILVKNKRHFQSHINLKCGFSDYHNIVGCITRLEMPPQIPITKRYRSYKTFNESNIGKDDSIDINSEYVTDVKGKHTNHPSITAIKS